MKKINKLRFIYFEVGLILALSFAIQTFQMHSVKRKSTPYGPVEPIPVSIDRLYSHTEEPPPRPKKTPTLKKQNYESFEKLKITDEYVKKVMDTKLKLPPIPIGPIHVEYPKTKRPAEIIEPDVRPSFPGGEKALSAYLDRNLKYPAAPFYEDIEGHVVVTFVVDEEGNITDVKATNQDVHPDFIREALRVIRSMPRWNPGLWKGEPVRARFEQSIVFKLY